MFVATVNSFYFFDHRRFCDAEVRGDVKKFGPWVVCTKPECRLHASQSCTASLPCGHACCGVIGENIRYIIECLLVWSTYGVNTFDCEIRDDATCVGCIEDRCPSNTTGFSKNDFCMICGCDVLYAAPCIRLTCGHVFHKSCCEQKISKKCVEWFL